MMKTANPFLLMFFASLLSFQVQAQLFSGGKFFPGYYYDINGEKVPGLINRYPSGKGIVKNEGFIEFKEDEKAKPERLSASMIHSFVIGRDSFAVAEPPRYGGVWTKNDLDFVQVVVDGPTKLYKITGGSGNGGSGLGIQPSVGTGIGTGGGGIGTGVGINLGSFGGGGGSGKAGYYYGETTGTMTELNSRTFVEIMTDVMGDEPQVVDKIKNGSFNLRNIEGLIKYYNEVQASHQHTQN